jgi:ParE toxin of type II toxin-antitoxin system, parDE
MRNLHRAVAQRLLKFLDERIRHGGDPPAIGEALRGERHGAYWKYRVGDYRLICRRARACHGGAHRASSQNPSGLKRINPSGLKGRDD